MQISKQQYTSEFKELAVKRVNDGLTAGAAAKELGLVEQTLRNWVKAAAAGMLNGAGAKGGHSGADGTVPTACRERAAKARE